MARVRFLKSAVTPDQYVSDDRPEIALAGRSNAGKSSLINAIAGEKVAKISQVPGKTNTLNFFDVGENYRFVDMPGYGFSKRSGSEQVSWEGVVESYLVERDNLAGVVLIIDSRRKWTDDEKMLVNWLKRQGLPVALVLTKVDKLKQSEKTKVKSDFFKASQVEMIFLVSSQTGEGIESLEESLYLEWIKPSLEAK